MPLLFDFFPILFFFIAYKFFGVYVATAVAMISSLLQVALQGLINRRLDKTPLITLVILMVLGGATLFFHDARFIKWKPTAIYWLFAAAFVGSHYIGNKLLIQRLMDNKIKLPAFVWKQLNISWTLFFGITGAINLWVAYHFDTNTWVNFKLFGMLGLMLLFTLCQGLYVGRYVSEVPPPQKTTEEEVVHNA